MRNRGLLTKKDRKVLRGEVDFDTEEERRDKLSDIRWAVKERMDKIDEDLKILRQADEDELVAQFYDSFGPTKELEQRIDELEEQLEQN